jgi:hypothetical protein
MRRGGAIGWEGDLQGDEGFAWYVRDDMLIEGEDSGERTTIREVSDG